MTLFNTAHPLEVRRMIDLNNPQNLNFTSIPHPNFTHKHLVQPICEKSVP
jgi:hypothetical protein